MSASVARGWPGGGPRGGDRAWSLHACCLIKSSRSVAAYLCTSLALYEVVERVNKPRCHASCSRLVRARDSAGRVYIIDKKFLTPPLKYYV